MKITSLDDKRKQKAMGEKIKLPVYNRIWRDSDGSLKAEKVKDMDLLKKVFIK